MARVVSTLAAGAAAALAYGALIERNAFTLRRFEVPVLAPGTAPIRLLHVSDLHITPPQRRKHAWIQGLATLRPDVVINTGDTLSAEDGIPAVMRALDPLFEFPGAFVPGNNDYYVPTPKNPLKYFRPADPQPTGPMLPWPEMARSMASGGWLDLTHRRERLTVRSLPVALAGTDDPHLRRARYELIAGPADAQAVVRIGVIHSPEPRAAAVVRRRRLRPRAGRSYARRADPGAVRRTGDRHELRDRRVAGTLAAQVGRADVLPRLRRAGDQPVHADPVRLPPGSVAAHADGTRSIALTRAGMLGRLHFRGVAQLGSALRSGRRGRGFESRHPDAGREQRELAHSAEAKDGVEARSAEYPDAGRSP